MKHKQHMSLIARRAQIRRAAAHRKDARSTQPAGRPVLRLVTATGYDTERDQLHEHREQASAID